MSDRYVSVADRIRFDAFPDARLSNLVVDENTEEVWGPPPGAPPFSEPMLLGVRETGPATATATLNTPAKDNERLERAFLECTVLETNVGPARLMGSAEWGPSGFRGGVVIEMTGKGSCER